MEKAKDIFLGFQSFLVVFLNNDIETIKLKQTYEPIGYFLGKLFDSKKYEVYGDIDYYCNEEELFAKIEELKTMYKGTSDAGLTEGQDFSYNCYSKRRIRQPSLTGLPEGEDYTNRVYSNI